MLMRAIDLHVVLAGVCLADMLSLETDEQRLKVND